MHIIIQKIKSILLLHIFVFVVMELLRVVCVLLFAFVVMEQLRALFCCCCRRARMPLRHVAAAAVATALLWLPVGLVTRGRRASPGNCVQPPT
jgi:hypothetical protein